MSDATTTEAARQLLLRFARGRGQGALRLAMHAAVPQTFQPELLHLLRINFVPEANRDALVAESDVLLAPFCTPLGADFFRFEPEVRRQLVEHLSVTYAEERPSRLRRVAALLLAHLDRLERQGARGSALVRDHVLVERWVAAAFLSPRETATQLARGLQEGASGGSGASRAQFGGLAPAVALPLAQFPELLAYAEAVAAVEIGDTRRAQELVEALPAGAIDVNGVTLPALRERTRRAAPSPRPARSAAAEAVNAAPVEAAGHGITTLCVFRPRTARANEWLPIFVFVRRVPVREPSASVWRVARSMLGSSVDSHSLRTVELPEAMASVEDVTLTLKLEGAKVEPSLVSLHILDNSYTQFRFLASNPGSDVHGTLQLRTTDGSPIVEAFVGISVEEAQDVDRSRESESGSPAAGPYRRVYACYAHRDRAVVESMRQLGDALGDAFFMDSTKLEVGVEWVSTIKKMIVDADVFQLFWSHNAAVSEMVHEEVRFALSLNRPNFVRPVYWETPMPEIPHSLDPLRKFHFARIEPDATAGGTLAPLRVHLVSTYTDLAEHRRVLFSAVRKALGARVRLDGAEEGWAVEDRLEQARRAFMDCDVCVIVVGSRYGSLLPGSELSETEWAFKTATEMNKRLLAFMSQPGSFDSMERSKEYDEPENQSRLLRFRDRITSSAMVSIFRSPDELASQLVAALSTILQQVERTRLRPS